MTCCTGPELPTIFRNNAVLFVDNLMEDRRQVEDTVVDVRNGTPVLVRDLARTVPGERPTYNVVTANGRPAF